MSDLQLIETALKQAARRRRLLAVWQGGWRGLLVGGGMWIVSIGVYKLLPVPAWTMLAGAGCGLLAFLVLVGMAGWRGGSLIETARWLDHKQALKERLSTALELASQPGAEDWRRLIVDDAARHVTDIDSRRLLPLRLPAVSRWVFLVLLLGVGLGFVPEFRTQKHVEAKKEEEIIRDTGKNLAELTRRNLRQKPPALQTTERALQEVAELGDLLAKVSLTKADALDQLSDVAKRLDEEMKQLDKDPALEALARAARQPGKAGLSTPQEMQNQMDALKKELGDAAGQGEALDKLQKDLRNLGKSARDMASQGGSGEADARAQMAQALADMAQRARDMGAALPGLEAAIAALQANQTDLFLKEMDAAMDDLEKVQEMARAMDQLEQQQAQVGKDLAEQLEKGQGRAAQSRLHEMIRKLGSSSLSPEQLQEIQNEVALAVKPGGEFGKVGEHLQNATRQLRQDDKQGASLSLAEAADELEKLMQQAEDSGALQAALQSLARAEQALAMGKTWSQCAGQPCAACNGLGCWQCLGGKRWGQGGGVGAGVGTWADDSNWNYARSDQEVDNSGILRPDGDPRGLSDRGAGQLNPNLLPDKVRGKISPGSSMPSITLKGVSVRGRSSVAFEEAATAAQTDAQSALNQDQVPRPYRGAVRDYFDDLKD